MYLKLQDEVLEDVSLNAAFLLVPFSTPDVECLVRLQGPCNIGHHLGFSYDILNA